MISLKTKVVTSSVPASYLPPDDMQGVLQAIPQFTKYSLDDTGANITINSTGAGNDPNGLFVWMLNQYKLPPRMLTGYRNNWSQIYTGKPNEISVFVGYPTGYFDASGLGIRWSGWEGWALCNGQNGTANLAQLFVVPGYRCDGGYAWVTNVAGYDAYHNQAGRAFTIATNNFPLVNLWINDTDFFKWTNGQVGGLWSVKDPSQGGDPKHFGTYTYPLDFQAQMVNAPVSRIPPYIAVGYVQFIGIA